jgi:hypothetical protein
MLDEETRTAIFKLHEHGHGSRAIAQALKVARATVRQVIRSGHRSVPPLLRAERCEPWREQILELHAQYQGHLGRVYDELLKGGATLSYPALTAFCRRHRIGSAPPPPAGHYEFPPGREMQHDTSPPHRRDRRRAQPRADRLGGAVLLADDLLPDVPAFYALRMQGVLDPGTDLF